MDKVPTLIDAIGVPSGVDLVARIPQQGIYPYRLLRVNINGPIAQFDLYKGSTSAFNKFSSVFSAGIGDAQFTPGEYIPAGVDIIGVWVNGGGYSGTMSITTDGGA